MKSHRWWSSLVRIGVASRIVGGLVESRGRVSVLVVVGVIGLFSILIVDHL